MSSAPLLPFLRAVRPSNDSLASLPSSASLPSLTDDASSASSSSLASLPPITTPPPPNAHLAVLLPRKHWKRDADAPFCDTFVCRRPFSVLERRHHCRKCGGVFCGVCSARTTPLLDTTMLPFLNPPRGVPLTAYASPTAPLLPARVCDACHDLIHGLASPRPSPLPPAPAPLPAPRRRRTLPAPLIERDDADVPPDLRAYPLRRPSSVCKRTGGGRWTPKPVPQAPIPGRPQPHELVLEREERAERRRRANPVVRDGEIMVRAPRPREPGAPQSDGGAAAMF